MQSFTLARWTTAAPVAPKVGFIFPFSWVEANVRVVCVMSAQCSLEVVKGVYYPASGQEKEKI